MAVSLASSRRKFRGISDTSPQLENEIRPWPIPLSSSTAQRSPRRLPFWRLALRGHAAWPRDRKRRPRLLPARYLPSISDLMIATIQPRHERLWQAAQNGNWEFAAYEFGNLQGAFNRIGRAHPTEHDISFPEMIASVTRSRSRNSTARSNPGTASHSPKPTPTLPTHVIPATRRSTMAWSKSAHRIGHLRQT